jgi:hypothetical protein
MARLILLVLALAACGKKADSRKEEVPLDAAPRPLDAAPLPIDGAPGDALTIRVEWKDAPSTVRTSPGLDPCGDPLPPFATVHTLHGVAGVAVWLDGAVGAADKTAPSVHVVTVGPCAVQPAVQVAAVGDELRVKSLSEKRTQVDVRWVGEIGAKVPETVVARIDLPVVGHAAAMPLEKEGVVKVGDAYVVVLPQRHAAVTDATGAAVIAGVPPGEHTVRAWLRGAAGEPARLAEGKVTVKAGEGTSVTVPLAPP